MLEEHTFSVILAAACDLSQHMTEISAVRLLVLCPYPMEILLCRPVSDGKHCRPVIAKGQCAYLHDNLLLQPA
jgi:hypothetical protein